MSLAQTPPTHWNCASCGQDFVIAIPASLANSPSTVRGTLVKYCPFCGQSSLRAYGATSEQPFWL
jgi:rRNA maturation protein Nop10